MIDYEYPDELKVYYKIVEVDEKEQLMVVRYWTDFLTEEELAVDSNRRPDGTPVRCRTDYSITIWDNIRTKEDVETLIINTIPVDWFKLHYTVKTPNIDHTINGRLSHLKELVGGSFEKIIPLKPVSNKENEETVLDVSTKNSETVLKELTQKIQKVPTLNDEELDELLELLVEK
jgi:hypothetical protein